MANFQFNRAKGRVVEIFKRVKENDPANSAIILVPLSATDTEANLQDLDDLTSVLAAAPNEQTAGGWGRKTLTDADLAAFAPDDANNRGAVATPQVEWNPGPTAPNNTVGLLVCVDWDTTAGTDANIEPLMHFDFVVNADGNVVRINAGDLLRST